MKEVLHIGGISPIVNVDFNMAADRRYTKLGVKHGGGSTMQHRMPRGALCAATDWLSGFHPKSVAT